VTFIKLKKSQKFSRIFPKKLKSLGSKNPDFRFSFGSNFLLNDRIGISFKKTKSADPELSNDTKFVKESRKNKRVTPKNNRDSTDRDSIFFVLQRKVLQRKC